MRRRVQPRPPVNPAGLLQFVYAEWCDESEVPPAHWPAGWPSWHLIGAYKRYSAAVREWCRVNQVSYADWQQMKRTGVIR